MTTITQSARSAIYCLALSLSVAVLCHPAQAQTFTDNTFVNSDWTSTIITNTSQGTFTAAQDTTSGAPPHSRRSTQTYNMGIFRVAHMRNNALYNPAASGAIAAVSYGYDLALHSGGSDQYSLLLLQNGIYYESSQDTIATGVWTPFPARSLDQPSFWKCAGSGRESDHPDFTGTGTPIQFGYATREASSLVGTQISTQSGIDNWSVSVLPVAKAPD